MELDRLELENKLIKQEVTQLTGEIGALSSKLASYRVLKLTVLSGNVTTVTVTMVTVTMLTTIHILILDFGCPKKSVHNLRTVLAHHFSLDNSCLMTKF